MPLFSLTTNVAVKDTEKFIGKASTLMRQISGKPESYVCVIVRDNTPMSFGGSSDPCGYLMVTNLGGFKDNKACSGHLSGLLERELGLPKDRVYIEFNCPSASDYGWNGTTFG